jgi:hypothetical protein
MSRLKRASIKRFTRGLTMIVHCVQVQASGIPSPRYEWYYRPNEEVGAATSDDFQWTILQEKTEKLPLIGQSNLFRVVALRVPNELTRGPPA